MQCQKLTIKYFLLIFFTSDENAQNQEVKSYENTIRKHLLL